MRRIYRIAMIPLVLGIAACGGNNSEKMEILGPANGEGEIGSSDVNILPVPPEMIETDFYGNPQAAETAFAKLGIGGLVHNTLSLSSKQGAEAEGMVNLGGDVIVAVDMGDGQRIVLNSQDAALGATQSCRDLRPCPGMTLIKTQSGQSTMVEVGMSPSDYGPWLTGNWMNTKGERNGRGSSEVEAGAFVDANELRGPVTVPERGTATYNGDATGKYSDGTKSGSHEFGRYTGDIALVATFGTGDEGVINGQIDNIEMSGMTFDIRGQQTGRTEAEDRGYTIALAEAAITGDGNFDARGLELSLNNERFEENNGRWSGRFSSVMNSDGNPRKIGGISSVTGTNSDGNRISFSGTFISDAQMNFTDIEEPQAAAVH